MLTGFGWILINAPGTGKHSRVIGWVALTISFVVIVTTMDRWIRYAQVFLGSAVIGSLVILARGHVLDLRVPYPRAVTAVLTLLLVGCSLIAGTLAKRRLQVVDRVALLLFVTAFAAAMGASTPAVTALCLGLGFAILLALWVYRRRAGEQFSLERSSNPRTSRP